MIVLKWGSRCLRLFSHWGWHLCPLFWNLGGHVTVWTSKVQPEWQWVTWLPRLSDKRWCSYHCICWNTSAWKPEPPQNTWSPMLWGCQATWRGFVVGSPSFPFVPACAPDMETSEPSDARSPGWPWGHPQPWNLRSQGLSYQGTEMSQPLCLSEVLTTESGASASGVLGLWMWGLFVTQLDCRQLQCCLSLNVAHVCTLWCTVIVPQLPHHSCAYGEVLRTCSMWSLMALKN